LNQEYSTEFMLLYSKLLVSDKISFVNPSDLKDSTLCALTKTVELEQRFVGIVEELQLSQKHNLSIDDGAIDKLSIGKKSNCHYSESWHYCAGSNKVDKQCEPLTNEQRKAVR
jgi:hypothetical protein